MATLEDVLGALTLIQQELVASKAETAALKAQIERMQRNPFDASTGRTTAGTSGSGGGTSTVPQVTVNIPTPIPLAAPERYAGDPNKVQVFLTQIVLHFSCRPTVFSTNQARVAFTISYLSGDAASWVVPLVSTNDPILTDWDAFRKEFEKVFDRRATTLCADRELLKLKQGKMDLVTYLTRFNQLIAETSWPEEKRLALYYQGLNEGLKDVLARIDPQPTRVGDLINLTLRLDHRLTERSGGRPRLDRSEGIGERVPLHDGGAEAMEVGTVRTAIPRTERENRRKNGLCMFCGKKGHYVRECMLRPRLRDQYGKYKGTGQSDSKPKENERA